MKLCKCIIISLLLLLVTHPIFAGEEAYISSLTGDDIRLNMVSTNPFTLSDGWFGYMQSNTDWSNRTVGTPKDIAYPINDRFVNVSSDGYVSLRWEGSEDIAFNSDWFYKIEVEIEGFDASNNSIARQTHELRIDYRVARLQNFKDWDVVQIPGAHRLTTKVLSIIRSTDGVNFTSPVSIVETDLFLELKISVNRAFSLDVTTVPTLYPYTVNSDRTVNINWAAIEGAEEYDLEWLYISSDLSANYTVNSIESLDDAWDKASRVSLNHNHYQLEMPYDPGIIFFRVRGVGYGNPLEHRLTTNWSDKQSLTINVGAAIEPLDKNKNWTYQVNYAEQGKRVESLNFADGTGRGRQSVTKDNSNNRAIISEAVFDREGRQALQVIPSVAEDHKIRFYQDYNLNATGTSPIHWEDFDKDNNYPGTTVTLSSNSGSSRYFSSLNSDAGTSVAAFVPDAAEQPYTRTVFDNQGRVKLQTGIGQTHSYGEGHETKFFHATAFQEDLDELFGSEIGYADHYSMQMTADPNGQLSISYTNLSGQTVATALIGDAPIDQINGGTLVEALDGTVYNYPTNRVKTRDLAPFNTLEEDKNTASWMVQKEFMATSPGVYQFEYIPNIGSYNQCFSGVGSCEFELKIRIVDAEGIDHSNLISNINLLTSGTPVPSTLGVFFDIEVNDKLTFDFNLNSLNLVGSYTIIKELRLKDISGKVANFKIAMDAYREAYMDYITRYYEAYQNGEDITLITPPVNSYSGCVDFATFLDTDLNNLLDPCLTQVDPNGPITNTYCEVLKNTLEQDLLPGGQYFENMPDLNTPDKGLNDQIWNLSTNPLSYTVGGITQNYNVWTGGVKNLPYDDIKNFMEQNNLFEKHPEWCLYEDRCIDPNGGATWYENLITQDLDWLRMDLAQATIEGYLTIPNHNGSPSFCVQNNGSWYGNADYEMFKDIEAQLPTNLPYRTELLDHIKWEMCHYAYTNGTYHDIGEIADLGQSNSSMTDLDRWVQVRAMMMECKRIAINRYFVLNVYANDPSCGFLVDADLNDNGAYAANGFEIRVQNYTEVRDQHANLSGLGANNNQTPSNIDATQAIDYANDIWQEYSICNHYEGLVEIDCSLGNTWNLSLDVSFDLPQYATPLNLGSFTLVRTDCHEDIEGIEDAIALAVANLPNDIKDDIEIIVRIKGTGKVEIVVRLAGAEVNSSNYLTRTNKYNNAHLNLSHNPSIPDDNFQMNFVDCDDLSYTTCVCTEINALWTELGDLSDVVVRYNNDLELTNTPDAITLTDLQYILEGYCGVGDPGWTPVGFTPFSVPSTAAPLNHLPLTYRPDATEDYFHWIDVFKSDPNIPTVFREAMEECLDVQGDLSCAEEALALALFQASIRLERATQESIEKYRNLLLSECMSGFPPEEFTMEYTDKSLHYTLYYYDASGNLERTVPPTGVAMLVRDPNVQTDPFQEAISSRLDPSLAKVEPSHRMMTTYVYNTLNETTSSTAPDRGTVYAYYDILGRPIFSQDAQQVIDGKASYMIYDALGRITETGVVKDHSIFTLAAFVAPSNNTVLQADLDAGKFPNEYVQNNNWIKSEVRTTVYNYGLAHMNSLFEDGTGLLRNRVGAQTYSMDGQNPDYQVAYHYDVFGNAKEVWQYYEELFDNQYKQLIYDYDLISGVVHQVDYQKGFKDQLSFKYSYDANNRLTKARSSTNGFIWNTDATYEYYLHGPLKRMEIGEEKVQGIDYVYNLQGWIKGVNSNTLVANLDPGRDGYGASSLHPGQADIHAKVAKDVFGYAVHYYDGDYVPINNSQANYLITPSNTGSLFNGNISSVTQAQTKPSIGGASQVSLPSIWKRYRYDQLHRIKSAQTEEVNVGANWTSLTGTTAYQTSYEYDPNGNILNLKRYDGTTSLIDDLSYWYTGTANIPTNNANPPQSGTNIGIFANNRLLRVIDNQTTARLDDIESQAPFNTGGTNSDQNYWYDANGSLIQDLSEEISTIVWTSEKKVQSVSRTAGSTRPELRYVYDFQGNRIAKVSIPTVSGQKEKHLVYVRDPQGNTLAVYDYQQKKGTTPISILETPVVRLKEQMIYGSDRLGIIKRNVQTGGPARVIGNGKTLLSESLTMKGLLNSYLKHLESDPSLTYTDYDKDRDTGVITDNVGSIDLLAKTANHEIKYKTLGTFDDVEGIMHKMERIRGWYRYELKNFRGDIRQVISDIKHREENNGNVLYSADVIQVTDGYSFGWDIAERSFTVDDHRFGFNGKENDKEWGNQLIQDYGFRLYNPAIAKFLSVDPLAPEYPWNSTYSFAEGDVIRCIDLDGLEKMEMYDRQVLGYDDAMKAHRMDDVYKYGSQGILTTMTYGSFVGNTFYNVGLFLSTGSTIGSRPFQDYRTGTSIRHGTYRSDAIQQEIAWTAVREGVYTIGGKAIGGVVGALYRGGKNLFGAMKPSKILNEGVETRFGTFLGGSTPNTPGSTLNMGLPIWLKKKFSKGLEWEADGFEKFLSHKNALAQKRVVPQNGFGNVVGNRYDADGIELNFDGITFTLHEFKLTSRSGLRTAQRRSQKHVWSGDGLFELRSNLKFPNGEKFRKGDIIEVTDFIEYFKDK